MRVEVEVEDIFPLIYSICLVTALTGDVSYDIRIVRRWFRTEAGRVSGLAELS